MPVRSLTLQLVHDSRKADYDWIYNFRIAAEVDGLGTLYAAGECPWYVRSNTSGIGCGIDCDGGSFGVDRVPGAQALWLSIDPSLGLRMKAGCGGRGAYRVKPAGSGAVFRLQQAPPAACRALEEMAAR
jgi:hypothetical protein